MRLISINSDNPLRFLLSFSVKSDVDVALGLNDTFIGVRHIRSRRYVAVSIVFPFNLKPSILVP